MEKRNSRAIVEWEVISSNYWSVFHFHCVCVDQKGLSQRLFTFAFNYLFEFKQPFMI